MSKLVAFKPDSVINYNVIDNVVDIQSPNIDTIRNVLEVITFPQVENYLLANGIGESMESFYASIKDIKPLDLHKFMAGWWYAEFTSEDATDLELDAIDDNTLDNNNHGILREKLLHPYLLDYINHINRTDQVFKQDITFDEFVRQIQALKVDDIVKFDEFLRQVQA